MPEVVVDGVPYLPAGDSKPRIGVGITTRNRPDVFAKTYSEIVRLTPGAKIVVVDDASDKPVEQATYRFDQQAGIARAKNKCLELLDDCEEIFLFDDDAYPLVEEWWRPYVESPEPHLMYIFKDLAKPPKLNDITVVYEDDQHIAYSGSRGVMLYVNRRVLDVAGGMDPGFGQWGYEHPDYSNRIHAFGLTTWRYADVKGSDKLIYSLDEQCMVVRTVDRKTRTELVERNQKRHWDQINSRIRYEYREQRDVVLTSLFTARPDPQRGTRMKADPALLAELAASVKKHGRHLVVFHDELTAVDDADVTYVRRQAGAQPYFQRWISMWQWLRDHPEVRFVWCVDGTDVEMLHDPFPSMQPGKLYLGSEHAVVDIPWLRENHKPKFLQEFMDEHGDRQLLNAGLVGGDRGTVMGFLHDIVRLYNDNVSCRFVGLEEHDLGVGDMAVFNQVAWCGHADKLVFGPRVNTVFKANDRNDPNAWFRHK